MLIKLKNIAVTCAIFFTLNNQSAFANNALADAASSGDLATVKSLLGQGIAVDSTLIDGSTALHGAVMQNRLDVVQALLKSGASATTANRYGVTPLYLAALNGSAEIAAELIGSGSDPNALTPTGETILMIAARTGTPEVLKLLLDAGADIEAREAQFSQTALMLAVRENNVDAISLLIARGADVNAITRVGEAPKFVPPCKGTGCGSEGVGINRGGLPDRGRRDSAKGGMTSLLYAARDGHAEAAELLIAAGADIEQADANAIRPLLMALLNNQLDVADQLLDAGAMVNVDDFWGRTPLFAAVEYRNLDMNNRIQDAPTHNNVDREAILPTIKRLLDAGADVNARTKEVPPSRKWLYSLNDVSWVDFTGETAFLRAAYSGDTTTMKLLLEYGADPNLATFAGTTPLMAAAGVNWVVAQTYTESMEGLIAAIRICLEHGADVNATNSMGLTALLGAANKGANDIIRLLVDEGARLDVVDAQGRDARRWAEGVFLAAVGAELKPTTIALLEELNAADNTAQDAN
ncbi:MAG: ankyrin repeat domain-containing protein [Pseudomonadota bacterium]